MRAYYPTRHRGRRIQVAVAALFALIPIYNVGCGGGGSAPVVQPITIGVTPTSASVPINGNQTFAATVTGNSNQTVHWDILEGASGGTVTSGGVYTAPAMAGTYHVRATSVADATKTAVAPVSVHVIVTIAPPNATITIGKTQTFTAAVSGNSNTAVTWSVQEGAAGGTITSGGVYTAPATAGTYHLVATSQYDATQQATSTITVQAGSVSAIVD